MSVERTADQIIVRDEAGRTLYLRPRFNFGIRQKLRGAAWHGVALDEQEVRFDTGDWNLTALSLMILKWEGPDFSRKSISIQTIMALPSSCDGILDEALGVIAEANLPQASPNDAVSSAATSAGAQNSEEPEPTPPVSSMSS